MTAILSTSGAGMQHSISATHTKGKVHSDIYNYNCSEMLYPYPKYVTCTSMYPADGQEAVYNIEPSLQLTEIMFLQLALIFTMAMNEQ
jgi:hypothetical protein